MHVSLSTNENILIGWLLLCRINRINDKKSVQPLLQYMKILSWKRKKKLMEEIVRKVKSWTICLLHSFRIYYDFVCKRLQSSGMILSVTHSVLWSNWKIVHHRFRLLSLINQTLTKMASCTGLELMQSKYIISLCKRKQKLNQESSYEVILLSLRLNLKHFD